MKKVASHNRGPALSEISVEEIMTKKVITVETEEPVFSMVKKMINKNVECVPVTKAGKLKGLITFRDVIRKVIYEGKDPEKMKAKDVMTKSVVTCYKDTTVLDVVKMMKNKRLRRIPVIDRSGRLVGLVTNFDLAIIGWDVD
ncbi:MAG: CBS domain-containing protein [Candidatus Hadarchaeaceae archaeon]